MAYSGSYPRPNGYGPPPVVLPPETAALGEPYAPIVARLRAAGISPTQSETVINELSRLRAAGVSPGTVAAVAQGWANHRTSGVGPEVTRVVGGTLTKLRSVGIGAAIVAEVAEALAGQSPPDREVAAAAQRDPGSFGTYAAAKAYRRAVQEERSPSVAATLARVGAGGRILGDDANALREEGWDAAAAHAAHETANRLGR